MKFEKQPLYKAIFNMNNLAWFMLGGLIALNGIVAYRHHQQINTAKTLVYTTCQQARQEASRASEQACGDAQDRLNMEYLCDELNRSANNHCWVEVK